MENKVEIKVDDIVSLTSKEGILFKVIEINSNLVLELVQLDEEQNLIVPLKTVRTPIDNVTLIIGEAETREELIEGRKSLNEYVEEHWREEYNKCLESPFYFFAKYAIGAEKLLDNQTEDEFNTNFRNVN